MLALFLDPAARQAEIKSIKNIPFINNQRLDMDSMIRRKGARKLLAENNPPRGRSDEWKWFRLSYLGAPFEKLAALLYKYGYRVGFYPIQTIRHLFLLHSVIVAEARPADSDSYRLTKQESASRFLGSIHMREIFQFEVWNSSNFVILSSFIEKSMKKI